MRSHSLVWGKEWVNHLTKVNLVFNDNMCMATPFLKFLKLLLLRYTLSKIGIESTNLKGWLESDISIHGSKEACRVIPLTCKL